MSMFDAGTAGTVEVDVVGDYSKFERGLKDQGTKAGNRFGSAMSGGIGSTIARAGGAYLGAQFGRSVRDQASDLEEAANVTGLAFGEARGEVDKLARSAPEMFGMAESEFRQLGAQMGNIFTGADIAQRDAAELTNDLIGRATDMGSAWNASTQEVSAAIQSGLVGSFEPLRKFGVILDANKVKQQAMAMGLIEEGEALDDASKQLAIHALIMESTENVAGDFANTSDGVANSSKIVGAQWKQMQAQLGQGLLPVLSMGLGLLKALGPEGMRLVVMGGALALVFVKMTQAAQAFGGALKVLAANPWVLAALAIVAVGVLIWRNWDTIVEKLGAAWDWVQTRAGELADWLAARWEDARRIASEVWNGIADFFRQWWPMLLGIFTGGIGLVVGLVVQNWDTVWAKTVEVWEAVTGFIGDKASAVGGFIESRIIEPGRRVVDWLTGLPDKATAAFNGLRDALARVADWIKTKLGEIRDAADRALGPIDEVLGKAASFGGSIGSAVGGLLGFDTGGVVPGPRGAPRLAVVHGGETILPTHRTPPMRTGAVALEAAPTGGAGVTVQGPLMVVNGDTVDAASLERYAPELVRVIGRELDRERRGSGHQRGGFTP